MNQTTTLLNNNSAKGIMTGLIMMTLTTLFWTGTAFYGLMDTSYWWLIGIFPGACIFFIYYAIELFKASKHLPMPSTAEQEDAKKRGKLFGIICAAEGMGIAVGVNVVRILHHPELQVPMIALAVGLHFFPLAKVFKRKMDYYIGLWTTAIALLAIFLMLDHEVTKSTMFAFTGIGLALATTYYGVNMIFVTRRVLARQSI